MVMHTGSCSRQCMQYFCRSQWPHDLRRGFAAAHLLVLWVRIPSAGVDVCRECWVCCQVERGLCVGLITRSDEFRPTNCVSESDRETSIMRKLSHKGLLGHGGGGDALLFKAGVHRPRPTKFGALAPTIFSTIIAAHLPRHVQQCSSAHVHRAEGPRRRLRLARHSGTVGLRVEFASCHHSAAKNL